MKSMIGVNWGTFMWILIVQSMIHHPALCLSIHPSVHLSIHPYMHHLSKHAIPVLLLGSRDTETNKTQSFHLKGLRLGDR